MTIAVQSTPAVSLQTGAAARDRKTGSADAFGAALSAAEQNDPAATAQPAPQPASLTTLGGRRYGLSGLTADYQEWRAGYEPTVFADRRQAVESQSGPYLALLEKASAQDGLSDPTRFLKSLSAEELRTLQTVHCLADPINPDGLTREGAQNLILPPNRAEDVDKDGFTMVGLARTWQFPPGDAPDGVKQAWKTATAGLDGGDLLLMSGSFLPLSIPGATGGSAFIPEDADYGAMTGGVIAGLEYAKRFDEPWQQATRERQIALLRKFQEALGAA